MMKNLHIARAVANNDTKKILLDKGKKIKKSMYFSIEMLSTTVLINWEH